MAKDLTRKTREFYERFTEKVEEKRAQPFTEADVERLLQEMNSEDEGTRAKAVREICPCSMTPEVFYRLRKVAKRLQKDPSPLVRSNAYHIEEDARMVESIEAALQRQKDREEEQMDVSNFKKGRSRDRYPRRRGLPLP